MFHSNTKNYTPFKDITKLSDRHAVIGTDDVITG